jgi:hypothetical protein
VTEDSSWEGWTMEVPSGSQVKEQPLGTYDDDGLYATQERVQLARETWPEGHAEDYDQIGRRRYRDRATGDDFIQVRGCPLLAIGLNENAVSVWFVVEGRFVFLRRADAETATSVRLGTAADGSVGIY